MWQLPKSRYNVVDALNFGPGLNMENNFDLKFNPSSPLVAVKYNREFWIMLLPCKRRQIQGQILYRYHVPRVNWNLDSCQWSPDGKNLLLLITQSPDPPGDELTGQQTRPLIFVVDDLRGRFIVKELRNTPLIIESNKLSSLLSGESITVEQISISTGLIVF